MYDTSVAKFLRKYAEPFEVTDRFVRQFPIKEVKSNINKGWVVIPENVKIKISEIADRIKGLTVCSINP